MIIRHEFPPRGARARQRNLRVGLGLALFLGFEGASEDLYPAVRMAPARGESATAAAPDRAEAVHMSLPHFLALGAAHFRRINPAIVVSPLLGPRADAMEIAQKLQSLGFTGEYHAVAPRVADATMITREVRAASPGVRFNLTQLRQAPIPA